MVNLQKSKYLLRNLVSKQKLCKKIVDQTATHPTLTQPIQICKKYFLHANILCKNCLIWLLLLKAFQRVIKCWNPMTRLVGLNIDFVWYR